jgi:hypothetical protein
MKTTAIVCLVLTMPCAGADPLRDPTRPPAPAEQKVRVLEPGPVLCAIIGPEGSRVAIFNGEPVRRGGSVGTYFIEAVFDDGVTYRHAGVTHELHLPRTTPVKKPALSVPRLPTGVN